MKLRFALPIAIVLMSCVMASPANAEDDSVEQAIEELGSSNVYIEPGTPGTNDQTMSSLQTKLHSDDGIILVMIPESDQPIAVIAKQIDEATGFDSIIGLAVGNDVLGYSTALPDGIAADLMQRADNVSTSPVEALVTFTRTTHAYETQNPDIFDPPPPPGGTTAEDSMAIWPFVLVGLLLVVAIVVAFIVSASRRSETQVRLKKSPNPVKDNLERLIELRGHVHDEQLAASIRQSVEDTEAFFAKYSSDREEDSRTFVRYLEKVVLVLEKYLDIQDSPRRYYVEPDREMESGKKTMMIFSDYVVKCIQRCSSAALLEYSVNQQILQAQRHS